MVDQKDMAETATHGVAGEGAAGPALRDEDGAIRPEFVETVAEAIAGRDAGLLRALVGELHESDTGDLIEALDHRPAPAAHRADGQGLRLHGADRSRRYGARGDPRGTAEPRPSPRACASSIPTTRSTSWKTCRRTSRPRSSSSCRRPIASRWRSASTTRKSSAGRRMQTEFIAVPPSWTVGQTIDYMRETEDLPERFFEIYVVDRGTASSSARCRSTG